MTFLSTHIKHKLCYQYTLCNNNIAYHQHDVPPSNITSFQLLCGSSQLAFNIFCPSLIQFTNKNLIQTFYRFTNIWRVFETSGTNDFCGEKRFKKVFQKNISQCCFLIRIFLGNKLFSSDFFLNKKQKLIF